MIKRKLKRVIYAINDGTYKGWFVVFIENVNGLYKGLIVNNFLKNNSFNIINVNYNDIKDGINQNILTKVKRLPRGIYKMLLNQYNTMENANEKKI